MATHSNQFQPDFAPKAPGEYLKMFLEERGIKIVDFARRTGRPTKTISEIISGTASITPDTALQFEKALGDSASFWLNLQTKYQLSQARAKDQAAAKDEVTVAWAKKFNINEMLRLRLLENKPSNGLLVDAILRAFGVSSVPAWEAHWNERLSLSRFKQQEHAKIDPYNVAVWLRCGELIANEIETAPHSASGFRTALTKARDMTKSPFRKSSKSLVDDCAEVGVAIAFVPSVPKTGLRGCAYWASKDKAVIAVSDRMKSEERMWFSFFHEACHILEHSKRAVFIDHDQNNADQTLDVDIEQEADNFAAEFLVTSRVVNAFRNSFSISHHAISEDSFRAFAKQNDVSAGLLLERLQYEGIIPQNSRLNSKIKRKLEFQL
ncbi:HigA family addiction module antitoxin [Leisingera sp. M658]|uniref:HigA family addiction module antitoxin n=1 Tax=Leisingera sp. M658 TaxID=2867015 RepID=UPI0021A5CCCF|nr:HigA family addiction module antitoxin [Leisingera sp. M658]UWQ74428.1 HigA family addiction module antidote protein [Leisingera sp. M658]